MHLSKIHFNHIITPQLLIVCLIFSFGMPANAAEYDYDQSAYSTETAEAPVANIKESEEGKLSIEFSDVGLSEVLKVLSSLSGANFVTSEDAAKKKISLFLDNVSFDDALEAIIKGNSLVMQKVGASNIILIRGITGEDALAPLETRVFKLKYVRAAKVKVLSLSESTSSSAGGSSGSSTGSGVGVGSSSIGTSATVSGGEPSEIKDTIEDLLSPRGKVTVDDRTNSLIVTDTPDRLEQIEKVVTILDHPLDQVLIEAIILETATDFDKYLGTDWGNGSGENNSLGTISGARGVFNIPSINQFGDLIPDNHDLLEEGTGLSFGSYDFSQMTATLRALQTDSRTKVLAKPRVLVLDNEPAFIKITVNEVIGVNSQVSAGGGAGENLTTETAERSETGVTLKVTPLINDENYITLLLEPRYATADTSTFNTDFRDPRIRATRTTLSVESGKVISISGLLQRDEVKIRRKVPILGDIPFFGAFFTKWTTNKLDRELMIFLRPVIVKREDSRIVQARSIPDKMTSMEEETSEFWKFWDKPWFKERYRSKGQDASEEVDQFFDERNKVIEQALQLESQKLNTVSAPTNSWPIGITAEGSGEPVAAESIEKETTSSDSNTLTNQPENSEETDQPSLITGLSKEAVAKTEENPTPLAAPANQGIPPQGSAAASPLRVKPA